ncbi:MAG TPA: hypothetical protein VMW54_08360 [Terriglobia bacterium]|nr:hypothetical protein [Terriglobia bacterium]
MPDGDEPGNGENGDESEGYGDAACNDELEGAWQVCAMTASFDGPRACGRDGLYVAAGQPIAKPVQEKVPPQSPQPIESTA